MSFAAQQKYSLQVKNMHNSVIHRSPSSKQCVKTAYLCCGVCLPGISAILNTLSHHCYVSLSAQSNRQAVGNILFADVAIFVLANDNEYDFNCVKEIQFAEKHNIPSVFIRQQYSSRPRSKRSLRLTGPYLHGDDTVASSISNGTRLANVLTYSGQSCEDVIPKLLCLLGFSDEQFTDISEIKGHGIVEDPVTKNKNTSLNMNVAETTSSANHDQNRKVSSARFTRSKSLSNPADDKTARDVHTTAPKRVTSKSVKGGLQTSPKLENGAQTGRLKLNERRRVIKSTKYGLEAKNRSNSRASDHDSAELREPGKDNESVFLIFPDREEYHSSKPKCVTWPPDAESDEGENVLDDLDFTMVDLTEKIDPSIEED